MNTEVNINHNIYKKALFYAQKQGLDLNSIIEDFLLRLVAQNQQSDEVIPDVVLSLLGAGIPISDDDLNGREAYYQYLEEKYK